MRRHADRRAKRANLIQKASRAASAARFADSTGNRCRLADRHEQHHGLCRKLLACRPAVARASPPSPSLSPCSSLPSPSRRSPAPCRSYATAPALLYVAGLMMLNPTEIEWDDLTEAAPAALTALAMPFTLLDRQWPCLRLRQLCRLGSSSPQVEADPSATAIVAALFIIRFAFFGEWWARIVRVDRQLPTSSSSSALSSRDPSAATLVGLGSAKLMARGVGATRLVRPRDERRPFRRQAGRHRPARHSRSLGYTPQPSPEEAADAEADRFGPRL